MRDQILAQPSSGHITLEEVFISLDCHFLKRGDSHLPELWIKDPCEAGEPHKQCFCLSLSALTWLCPSWIRDSCDNDVISVESLSLFSSPVVSDSATPWIAARQASLSFTVSPSLPKLTSIASVMLFIHLILWHPSLLSPSIFPNIRDFPLMWCCSHQVTKASVSVLPMNAESTHPQMTLPFHYREFQNL